MLFSDFQPLRSHPQVVRLLQSGGPEVNQCPIDKRKFNGRKDCQKADSADSFFNYYYHHIVSRNMFSSHGFQISCWDGGPCILFLWKLLRVEFETRLRLWQKLHLLKMIHISLGCIALAFCFQAGLCKITSISCYNISPNNQ